jgi:UDP-N-acetyl-D-mannosaminuronate dehydrogenase
VLQRADVMVLLTDHTMYRDLQPTNPCLAGLTHKRLIDTRGCMDGDLWRSHGFDVLLMGGGPSFSQSALR